MEAGSAGFGRFVHCSASSRSAPMSTEVTQCPQSPLWHKESTCSSRYQLSVVSIAPRRALGRMCVCVWWSSWPRSRFSKTGGTLTRSIRRRRRRRNENLRTCETEKTGDAFLRRRASVWGLKKGDVWIWGRVEKLGNSEVFGKFLGFFRSLICYLKLGKSEFCSKKWFGADFRIFGFWDAWEEWKSFLNRNPKIHHFLKTVEI